MVVSNGADSVDVLRRGVNFGFVVEEEADTYRYSCYSRWRGVRVGKPDQMVNSALIF